MEYINSENSYKTKSDFIFTTQSINIVSIGGYIYNSLDKSYDSKQCKFIITNNYNYLITLYFESLDNNNKTIKDSLIFVFTNYDDLNNYKYILLEYFRNVTNNIPIFYETEKVYNTLQSMSYELLIDEIKSILLNKMNNFFVTYNVDLDLDTLQFCFCYLFKNYYKDYGTYGYFIYNCDFIYYIDSINLFQSKTTPEFFISMKKIRSISTWFSENLIEIYRYNKPKLYFIQDGSNEFISKINNKIRNFRIKNENYDIDVSLSRTNNRYLDDSDYLCKLNYRLRKDYMILCMKSMARGHKMYFARYFFYKFFAKFYRTEILYQIIDKIAYRNPLVFHNAIEPCNKSKSNALVKYEGKSKYINYSLIAKHSRNLENFRDLNNYVKRNKEYKDKIIEKKLKDEEERAYQEHQTNLRTSEEHEKKREEEKRMVELEEQRRKDEYAALQVKKQAENNQLQIENQRIEEDVKLKKEEMAESKQFQDADEHIENVNKIEL